MATLDQLQQLYSLKTQAEKSQKSVDRNQIHEQANQLRTAMGKGSDFASGLNAQQFKNQYVAPAQRQSDMQAKQDQLSGQVNSIYDSLQQSQLNQLRSQQEKATSRLNQQKQEYGQQIYGQKNQADVQNAQGVARLREIMAANGLGASGENVTAQTSMANQRTENLNALDQQQNNFNRDIQQQLSDVNDPWKQQAIIDQLAAQRAQSLMGAQNTAFNQGMSEAEFNAMIEQQSTLNNQWKQEFDYTQQQDETRNNQWQQTFDENVRQFGINNALDRLRYDLDKQVSLGNLSLSQARQSLSQAQFSYNQKQDAIQNQLAREKFDWEKNQANQPYSTGSTGSTSVTGDAYDYVDTLNDRFLRTDEMTGKQSISDQAGLYRSILGLNLSDDQTQALMQYYGINPQ